MPRRGESIYKRKDGRWEARYIHHYENGRAKYIAFILLFSHREGNIYRTTPILYAIQNMDEKIGTRRIYFSCFATHLCDKMC